MKQNCHVPYVKYYLIKPVTPSRATVQRHNKGAPLYFCFTCEQSHLLFYYLKLYKFLQLDTFNKSASHNSHSGCPGAKSEA